MDKETKLNLIEILQRIVKIRWLFLIGLFVLELITQSKSQGFFKIEINFLSLFLGGYFILNTLNYLYLLKKERCNDKAIQVIKFLQVLIEPILFTVLVYYSGGIENHLHTLYFFSIIIASILYRPIVVILELLYSSILYLGVILIGHFNYLSHTQPYLVPRLYFDGTLQDKLLSAFNIIFILWIVGILAIYLVKLLYQREEQLIGERNKTRSTIEALTDGLVMFDQDLKITIVNKRAEEIFKIKKQDFEGKNLMSLDLNTPLRVLFNLVLEVVDKQKKVFLREITLKNREPALVIQTSVVSVLDKQGNRLGVVQIFHDISREKAIDAMKSEFISIAAHQLRTPLSVIKWILKMLTKGDFGHVSKKQKEYLDRAYFSNEQMIELVNDLLDVTRIEEGRFGYKFKLENVVKITSQIVEDFRESDLGKQKQLQIKFLGPKRKLPRSKVDKNRFIMVLQNLLDNAVKYSRAKTTIIVKIQLSQKGFTISVQDQGVGIPSQEQNKVFSKFFRGTNVTRMETRGSGLGLFIARNIIKAHGGNFWFKSKLGHGTTFFFTLPLAQDFVFKKSKLEFEKFLKSF
jgi:two-component system phosphate regulon sensor histidine kinase PhoR